MTVTSEEFKAFVARHSSLNHIIAAESNDEMRNSYLILDEYMRFVDVSLCVKYLKSFNSRKYCVFVSVCVYVHRFLDNSNGSKTPSVSILDVGVKSAMSKSGFDRKMFIKRGGKYVWSKKDMKYSW